MKSQVNFSIDTEVLIELDKEDVNKSALVEGFLREYLQLNDKEKVNPKELEKLILKAKIRVDTLEAKRKEVEAEEKARIEEEAKRLNLNYKDMKFTLEGDEATLFTKEKLKRCIGCRKKLKTPFYICKDPITFICEICEKEHADKDKKICERLGAHGRTCKTDHMKVILVK